MTQLFNHQLKRSRLLCAIAVTLLSGMVSQSFAALSDYQSDLDSVTTDQGFADQDARLTALMDLIYDYKMTEYPETATWLGYLGQNNRWTDHSLVAINQGKRDSHTTFQRDKNHRHY